MGLNSISWKTQKKGSVHDQNPKTAFTICCCFTKPHLTFTIVISSAHREYHQYIVAYIDLSTEHHQYIVIY